MDENNNQIEKQQREITAETTESGDKIITFSERHAEKAEPERVRETETVRRKIIAKKQRSTRRKLVFFGIRLLIGVIIITVATLIIFREQLGTDRLVRRIFGSKYEDIAYDASNQNLYAFSDRNFLIVSIDGIDLWSDDGERLLQLSQSYSSPCVSSQGGYFCIYDLGGTKYLLIGNGQLLYENVSEGKIIGAEINKNGYLALLTEEANYRARLEAVSPAGEIIYRFHSSQRYVFDAAVSPDSTHMTATCFHQDEGVFESSALFFDLLESEPKQSADISESLAIWCGYLDDEHIAVLFDDQMKIYTNNGDNIAGYVYNENELRTFAMTGSGELALCFNKYTTGERSEIVLFSSDGQIIGKQSFEDESVSMTASEDGICVVFPDTVVWMDTDLTVKKTYSSVESIKFAACTEKGVFTVTSGRAGYAD